MKEISPVIFHLPGVSDDTQAILFKDILYKIYTGTCGHKSHAVLC